MWLSVPRTKTSIRRGPQETAPGSSSKMPPSRCHPLKVPAWWCTVVVSIHLYQSELSPPFAKQSSRFAPHEATDGVERMMPPRSSQPCHALPSHHLCHMWLSIPRTKQSTRLGPQETAAGVASMHPPRSCHALHTVPFHHL